MQSESLRLPQSKTAEGTREFVFDCGVIGICTPCTRATPLTGVFPCWRVGERRKPCASASDAHPPANRDFKPCWWGGEPRKDIVLFWATFSSPQFKINGWLCLFHLRIGWKVVFKLQGSLCVLQSGDNPHRPGSRQQSQCFSSGFQMHSCRCPENRSTVGRDLLHFDEKLLFLWKYHHLHTT